MEKSSLLREVRPFSGLGNRNFFGVNKHDLGIAFSTRLREKKREAMEEGKVTATGGRGAERDGADWTYLVRMYLSGCCGACSRRSLRCHTATFIHLERFEGLSCARKFLRRLRRLALDSASKERHDLPCSGVSVVLLWRMLTALLALPYLCFYTFGKI